MPNDKDTKYTLEELSTMLRIPRGSIIVSEEKLRYLLEQNKQLRDERDDYRKVLEWYETEAEDAARRFHIGLINSEIGNCARTILKQYEKEDSQNE